jgi:hypothetical protein
MSIAVDKKNENGAVLIGFMLVVLMVLALVGAGLIEVAGANAVEGGKSLADSQAFWLAEAGMHDALTLARVNIDRDGESSPFPSIDPQVWTVELELGSYTVEVTDSGGDEFVIESTGTSKSGFSRTVSVNYSASLPSIFAGAFGNQGLQVKPGLSMYSYNSETTPNPRPLDSTGEVVVSANSGIEIKTDKWSVIDGVVYFGVDESGTGARYTSIFSGPQADQLVDAGVDAGPIPYDPLGLFGDPSDPGTLASKYQDARTINDNSSIIVNNGELDSSDRLTLDKNGSVELVAGTYHFDGWELGDRTTVKVDASDGNVDIYMSDIIDFSNGDGTKWEYNLLGGGAGDVRFFFAAPSGTIEFRPNSSMACFIYAPELTIKAKPNLDFYGSIWAKDVQIWPNADVFIDTSIMNDESLGGGASRYQATKWRQSTIF